MSKVNWEMIEMKKQNRSRRRKFGFVIGKLAIHGKDIALQSSPGKTYILGMFKFQPIFITRQFVISIEVCEI